MITIAILVLAALAGSGWGAYTVRSRQVRTLTAQRNEAEGEARNWEATARLAEDGSASWRQRALEAEDDLVLARRTVVAMAEHRERLRVPAEAGGPRG